MTMKDGRTRMTPAKKTRAPVPQKKLARAKPQLATKLSNTEEDLIWHMAHGYRLETSSLGDNPVPTPIERQHRATGHCQPENDRNIARHAG